MFLQNRFQKYHGMVLCLYYYNMIADVLLRTYLCERYSSIGTELEFFFIGGGGLIMCYNRIGLTSVSHKFSI